ncbi:hypothetical protein PCANC_11028 [Puccinia coronata f. sp. avenae]|uniref:Uncharacterized protein n=1 Tax=Puccinia coronata f. sp. avenae TaxID=200324 RepID=A0A2N5U480_9BASI|nr:hypothetical protein PCASD_09724 [Puccinia coronata f. sp. avenae]PLW40848.1 hypothetical protein PCANC_11028 [Puccinia coronata f. sp. avenae]
MDGGLSSSSAIIVQDGKELDNSSSVIEGQPDLQHAGISDSSRQIMPGFFGP